MRSKEPVRIGKAKVSKQIEALKKKAYISEGQGKMIRIIFCMFTFIMKELIFPVKGFFMEDALEDLLQSKALLEKKKQYRENGQVKN